MGAPGVLALPRVAVAWGARERWAAGAVVLAVHGVMFALLRPHAGSVVVEPPVITVQLATPLPLAAAPRALPAPAPAPAPRTRPAPAATPSLSRPVMTPQALPPTAVPLPVSDEPGQPPAPPAPPSEAPLVAPAPPTAPAPAAASSAAPAAAVAEGSADGPVQEPMVDAKGRNVPAVYPRLSRQLREEGRVLLNVLVLADGRVGEVSLRRSSGYPRLDAAALEAVRQWVYEPARRGGRPVDFQHIQPVNFRLNQ